MLISFGKYGSVEEALFMSLYFTHQDARNLKIKKTGYKHTEKVNNAVIDLSIVNGAFNQVMKKKVNESPALTPNEN